MRIHDIQDEDGRIQAFEVPTFSFLVHEHWGESDRYWVGPAEAGWCPQLAVIRETFARARPFLWFVRF